MVSKLEVSVNIAGSASLMVTGQAALHPAILSAVAILLPYRMQSGSLAMLLLPGRLWQNIVVPHLTHPELKVQKVA